MAPKEKAKELFDKYNSIQFSAYINDSIDGQYTYNDLPIDVECIKECALICVDEILNTSEYLSSYNNVNGIDPFEYWEQVKQEIGKL